MEQKYEMKKIYVYHKEDGEIVGFFNENQIDRLPKDITDNEFITITEKERNDAIKMRLLLKVEGDKVVGVEPTTEEQQYNEVRNEIGRHRHLLNTTDWYVTRLMDTGMEIPEDIKIKRQIARNYISDNRHILEKK